MEFLASYWWLFVALMVVFGGISMKLQASRVSRLQGGMFSSFAKDGDPFAAIGKATQGSSLVLILMLIAGVNGLLAIIGIVIAVIEYVKTT